MGTAANAQLNTLYFGTEAAGRRAEILASLEAGKPLAGLYLLTFAANGVDQLDILPAYALRQKTIRQRLPLLVGYAFGRDEAFALVAQIAEDAFRQTGCCRLQEYLLQQPVTA